MSNARLYTRSLMANWVGFAANLLVMFFLSPFIVDSLGKAAFGVWSLLNVMTGYMGMADLGVRASTGRYVVLYFGQGDHRRVQETIRTGLGFFTLLSGGLILIAVALGQFFPVFFPSTPATYHGAIRVLCIMLAADVWLNTVAAILTSVLSAHDRFDLARGIDLVGLAVRTVGTIAVLKLGYGIIGLGAVVLVVDAIRAVANYVVAQRLYPHLRCWPLAILRPRLRELLGFGIAATIGAIAQKVISQTDLIIVGAVFDVDAVAVYSVAGMLFWYAGGLLQQISVSLFPATQRAAAVDDLLTVRRIYLLSVRLALLVGTPLMLGFIVFGRAFLVLWMGPDFSVGAIVLIILSIYRIVNLFSMPAASTVAALGHISFSTVLWVVEAVANVACSLLFTLVLGWGLGGVAAGTLTAFLIVRAVILPIYLAGKMQLPLRRYLAQAIMPGLLAGALTAAAYVALAATIPHETWVGFWISVAAAAVAGGVLGWVALLQPEDRQRVLDMLRRRRPQPAPTQPPGA